jgi:hypothetical protein
MDWKAKKRSDYVLTAAGRSESLDALTTNGNELAALPAAGTAARGPSLSQTALSFWAPEPHVAVAATYDRLAADVLADIAAWSYSDGQTLLDELYHRRIIDIGATCHQIAVSNEAMLVVATAYFIRSHNVGVLCFRGTEPSNVINFLTDANVSPKGFLAMGRIHGGFHRNVRAVWDDVAEHIRRAVADEDPARCLRGLYLTGHSLGGAMAVIAAATIFGDARYATWQPLVRGVYTYGQPMVGDEEFARSCESRFGKLVFRHIYEHDLVARMPPLTTGRFKHFGAEYAGTDKGWTPRTPVVDQALTALWSIPIGAAAFVVKQLPLLSWLPLPFSIDDHSPNGYLEAFRAVRDWV